MCARKVVRLDTSFGKYTPDVVAKPVDTYVTPSRATTNVVYSFFIHKISGECDSVFPVVRYFLSIS